MNYNHLMEKYELYGGIFVHLTKVKKIQPNLFPICNTLWNSQRRHKKSSNRNGQLLFFFQNFSSQRSFFFGIVRVSIKCSHNSILAIISLKFRSENLQLLIPIVSSLWDVVRYLKNIFGFLSVFFGPPCFCPSVDVVKAQIFELFEMMYFFKKVFW